MIIRYSVYQISSEATQGGVNLFWERLNNDLTGLYITDKVKGDVTLLSFTLWNTEDF